MFSYRDGSETAAGRRGVATLRSQDSAEISLPNIQANPLQTSGPYIIDENHKKVLKFHFLDPSKVQKTISTPKSGVATSCLTINPGPGHLLIT
jgi:hypothetical protein